MKMKNPWPVIDFHSHAFPDSLAPRALEKLEESSGTKAWADGTIRSLLESMDESGIDKAIVSSVATSPTQTDSIREWSLKIRSSRIIPFPSVHPDSEDPRRELQQISADGFLGIKLHPQYQDFYFDDDRVYPIYDECQRLGLMILFHVGEDISFGPTDKGAPRRLSTVRYQFTDLKIIAGHTGGWRYWHETEKHLLGKDIYFDLSYTHGHLDRERFRSIIINHRQDRLLFGSDFPWMGQKETIENITSLNLDDSLMKKIMFENAAELLYTII